MVTIYGLVNGPSAVSNTIDADLGQTTNVECISKSSNSIPHDTITVTSGTIAFTAYLQTSGFTFTLDPVLNNGAGTISLVIYMT
jgi:hypothetical protein